MVTMSLRYTRVFQKLGSRDTMPSMVMFELCSIFSRLAFSICARMEWPLLSRTPRPMFLAFLFWYLRIRACCVSSMSLPPEPVLKSAVKNDPYRTAPQARYSVTLLFTHSSPTRYLPGGKYRMFWVAVEAVLMADWLFDVISVAPVLSTL